jgi:hypothetical protein
MRRPCGRVGSWRGLNQSTRERVQHRDLSSEIEEASEGISVRLHRGKGKEEMEMERVPLSAGHNMHRLV